MKTLSLILPGVACAGGMEVCMYLMRGGQKDKKPATAGDDRAVDSEVAALRDEVARLRQEQAEGRSPVDG